MESFVTSLGVNADICTITRLAGVSRKFRLILCGKYPLYARLHSLLRHKGLSKDDLPPHIVSQSLGVLYDLCSRARKRFPSSLGRASFDYNADDGFELTALAGELLYVLNEDQSGWWRCAVVDQTWRDGAFPSEFMHWPLTTEEALAALGDPDDDHHRIRRAVSVGIWVFEEEAHDVPSGQPPPTAAVFPHGAKLLRSGIRMTCGQVRGDRFVHLQGFLSDDQCRSLVSMATRASFQPNGTRDMAALPGRRELADKLWLRMKHFTVGRVTIDGVDYTRDHLSADMRAFRYVAPQRSHMHIDGGSDNSLFSFVMYLTDTGGAKTIFGDGALAICPAQGDALLFRHNLPHEAESPAVGHTKICLRADVVYRCSS